MKIANNTTEKGLLDILKHEDIPITWATLYWGVEHEKLTNQEVINHAIELISPDSCAIDKHLIPLASARESDPNILQLLERLLPYDAKKPEFANEAKKWRYVSFKQVHEKYINKGSLIELEELHRELRMLYVDYDYAKDLNDLIGWLCFCCVERLTTTNELMLSLHQFLSEQYSDIKQSDKSH